MKYPSLPPIFLQDAKQREEDGGSVQFAVGTDSWRFAIHAARQLPRLFGLPFISNKIPN